MDVAPPSADDIGARLMAVVADAVAADVDPESALRQAARKYRAALVELLYTRPVPAGAVVAERTA